MFSKKEDFKLENKDLFYFYFLNVRIQIRQTEKWSIFFRFSLIVSGHKNYFRRDCPYLKPIIINRYHKN